ncbi:hypothetical protein M436DRAFT_80677 [Aureobasidium namibiae CBS 147.97]|uniref:Vacuolar ATPase assembly protein VMA22 n=1 Tax=Aureobasidium namibiae CBS 147.97 TaxID=1043004 RepID=A0A074WRM8_9PEZI
MADENEFNAGPGVDELRDQLDTLWEKHLTLLDSYHQAQQQIARHFSSGFFHLAQATFKSTTRVRYGQEYYDDRMQATTRFEPSIDTKDVSHLALKLNHTPCPSTKHSDKESTEMSPHSKEKHNQEKQADKLGEQGEEDKPEEQNQEDKPDDKEKTHNKLRDPLHWYGILVPPSLRASQKSFSSAMHDPVINAANSAQALRRVDMDIRKLRKDIKKAEKRVV